MSRFIENFGPAGSTSECKLAKCRPPHRRQVEGVLPMAWLQALPAGLRRLRSRNT